MLKFRELYDPIERTTVMTDEEIGKYASINQNHPGPVDPATIKHVHDVFYESHTDVDREKLDHMWATIAPRLENNHGLVQFTLDYHGAESEFFFPWLIEIGKSPSGALELSYGAGYNLAGDWIKEIPHSDPIDAFVRNDPALVYNRERQLATANHVFSFAVALGIEFGCKVKVVDLGAGRLAWARWHGLQLSPAYETVIAFDKDPTIDPPKLFDRDMRELGITYHHGDLMSQIKNPICKDSNIIILGGVATYFPFDIFTDAVLAPVHQLLVGRGIFFFDLQLDCPVFRRNASIFGWPPMNLPKTASEAIDMVEQARKRLWHSDIRYGAEYALDTYNESPTALMITLTKITP